MKQKGGKMPTEKLSMRKIREVLRLHYEESIGNREIARRLKMSPGSVSNYLIRIKAAQLAWPLPEEWTEDKLYNVLFPAAPAKTI
jgi:DNA-binding MarR family transcriptional regulator